MNDALRALICKSIPVLVNFSVGRGYGTVSYAHTHEREQIFLKPPKQQ